MLETIIILLWVCFTLFSIFGGIGLDEIFPVFNTGYAGIILVLNFFLSNIIGSIVGGPFGRVNRVLILLGIGVMLLAFQTYGVYYLFWEVCEFEYGFWSSSFFIFILIIVLTFGGIRQVLLLTIKSVKIGLDNYFNSLAKGIYGLVDYKVESFNTSVRESNTKISKQKPEKVNLNSDLYNY
jgi:hypothetical protein